MNGTRLFFLTINQRIPVKDRVWVNFKELREQLQFEDVLRHYNVEIQRKGDQHQGPCPLPNHSGKKDGPSFSANLKRGLFNCFSCGQGGNLLEFAGLMSGIDLKDGSALRKVAVELQQKFCPNGASSRTKQRQEVKAMESKVPSVVVNAPLDFELKGLDAEHSNLRVLGLSQETISKFGLGFCSRGLLKGRIAIPLHDQTGKRIGYAGRLVDVSEASDSNPCYLFPEVRERDNLKLIFNRSLFLYHGHMATTPCEDLVMVEDIASVWWLEQCGFSPTLATMGLCSKQQAQIVSSLLSTSGRIWVISNESETGTRFANSVFELLSPHCFVRWLKLHGDSIPTNLSLEEINKRFTS